MKRMMLIAALVGSLLTSERGTRVFAQDREGGDAPTSHPLSETEKDE